MENRLLKFCQVKPRANGEDCDPKSSSPEIVATQNSSNVLEGNTYSRERYCMLSMHLPVLNR